MHVHGKSEPSKQPETAMSDQDDDDAPMVHKTPRDYKSWAIQHREELQKEGKEVILQSEVSSYIPRRDGESAEDYTKRYCDEMNAMIRRGVQILNDMTTHDVKPNFFELDGHGFDVGPKSGITKREYREFGEWMGSEGALYENIPERFLRFETEPMDEEPCSEPAQTKSVDMLE